jgi:hypothetical protein
MQNKGDETDCKKKRSKKNWGKECKNKQKKLKKIKERKKQTIKM